MRIFTIGYEATTTGEFIAALQGAGVKRVIDVRAVPNSRRPGFSKTPLRNALAEVESTMCTCALSELRRRAARRLARGGTRI